MTLDEFYEWFGDYITDVRKINEWPDLDVINKNMEGLTAGQKERAFKFVVKPVLISLGKFRATLKDGIKGSYGSIEATI